MSAAPTLLVVGRRRRRGRPPVDEPRSSVSTWVPTSLHDTLIKSATAQDISISELVRRALVVSFSQLKK